MPTDILATRRVASLLLAVAAVTSAATTRADPAREPRNQAPRATRAGYDLAASYRARADFDRAVVAYETYAADETAVGADEALAEAVALRLGLGSDDDVRMAVVDAATFQRRYRGTKSPHAGSIALALGAHYFANDAWDDAIRVVREALPAIDAVAGVDIQVQAHALLGRAYAKQNRRAEALMEYGRVRDLWADPGAASQKLRGSYPGEDDGQVRRRRERALYAVGEALFSLAEATKTATLDPIAFPVYAGPNDRDDVRKHIVTRVADWVKKRTLATIRVEQEYERVLTLRPEPPARWVTATSLRRAALWGSCVGEFRGAPIPKSWAMSGCAVHCGTSSELAWEEIRGDYYAGLDEAAEPIKTDRAKPAFVACVRRATSAQYFDDAARRCELWLGRSYAGEFHTMSELYPAPTFQRLAPAEAPPQARPRR